MSSWCLLWAVDCWESSEPKFHEDIKVDEVFQTSQIIFTHGHHLNIKICFKHIIKTKSLPLNNIFCPLQTLKTWLRARLTITTYIKSYIHVLFIFIAHTCQTLNWRQNSSAPLTCFYDSPLNVKVMLWQACLGRFFNLSLNISLKLCVAMVE